MNATIKAILGLVTLNCWWILLEETNSYNAYYKHEEIPVVFNMIVLTTEELKK